MRLTFRGCMAAYFMRRLKDIMKKSVMTILMGLILITLVLTALWIYSDRSLYEIEQQGSGQRTYERHYALISQDRSDLWESIFHGSAAEAGGQNAYLEWIGEGSSVDMSIEDCMRIAVASRVDGIILHPGSSAGKIDALIDEAADAGIPVVTALEDESDSQRISYVGLSGYEMGEFYGQQILAELHPGLNRISILSNAAAGTEDPNLSLMYSQMIQAVESGRDSAMQVTFETKYVNTATSFDAEEDIRDIFVNPDNLPDVLICLDLISTECAAQALIDHNEVGNVTVIGYYASDSVLDAVAKGVMRSTLGIDGEEVGRKCVEALDEYHLLGNVSDYFNVSPQLIDQNSAEQRRKSMDMAGDEYAEGKQEDTSNAG